MIGLPRIRKQQFGACSVSIPALACVLVMSLFSQPAGAVWSHFEMNRADGDGDYLWSYAENWSYGVPVGLDSAEIGDDSSGRAVHSVIKSFDATVLFLELAEHDDTEGSSLRLTADSSLTVIAEALIAKDREGWFYLDGVVDAMGFEPGKTFRVGGMWGQPGSNLPASGHVIIGPSGTLNAWYVGINTTYRADNAPSSPWGSDYFAKSTDSEIVVNGGTLYAQEGLRMTTTQADRPPSLILRDDATLSIPNRGKGMQIWAGTWEIEGGEANIHVRDIEFWGNKFEDEVNPAAGIPVGSGKSILKLSGWGVSTIYADGEVDFVDAAELDVSELQVAPGSYKVIDASSFINRDLQFAAGTNTDAWAMEFDLAEGDLWLTYSPELIPGDANGDGYVDDDDLSLLLSSWGQVADWANGEFSGSGPVDDDDLSILLVNWHEGTPPAAGELIPEPATFMLLATGAMAVLRRRTCPRSGR